ncbi:long-chain-fatty-acid--CoA ligase 1 [Trichonephila clavipes]|nr:long-chain-fatty-acid--CoA ligase 1 [Trichonephila clavipes]
MTDKYPGKQIILKKTVSIERKRGMIKIYPPPARMSSQSVMLPGPERIRASGATINPEQYVQFPDDKTHTVCDTVLTGLLKSTSGECLGLRSPLKTGKYKWITYSQLSIIYELMSLIASQTFKIVFVVAERKDYIGSGLLQLGIPHSKQAMVGICTKTRPEFVLVMLACSRYSMVLVPLYLKMEVLFCEDSKFAVEIMENEKTCPALKHIVLIDANEDEMTELHASYPEMHIISLKDLEKSGKSNLETPEKLHQNYWACTVQAALLRLRKHSARHCNVTTFNKFHGFLQYCYIKM